jgi:hypothetical protein
MTVDDLALFHRVQRRGYSWYLDGPDSGLRPAVGANPGYVKRKAEKPRRPKPRLAPRPIPALGVA